MGVFETWRISSSDNACAGCGAEFRPNQSLFSALEEEADGFVRHDFCADCWPPTSEGEFFCHWRTRRAEAEKKQTLDTDLMLEFFRRLCGSTEQNKKVFRFVLALYLMRRKELKLLRVERKDGAEFLIFEHRSSDDESTVENPDLTEEQLRETADGLGRLFDAEL